MTSLENCLEHVYSIDVPYSNNILIYKIGDYANFTEVNNFINENNADSYYKSTTPPKSTNNNRVVVGATLGILSIIILGFIGFIIFKRYKKSLPIIQTA